MGASMSSILRHVMVDACEPRLVVEEYESKEGSGMNHINAMMPPPSPARHVVMDTSVQGPLLPAGHLDLSQVSPKRAPEQYTQDFLHPVVTTYMASPASKTVRVCPVRSAKELDHARGR